MIKTILLQFFLLSIVASIGCTAKNNQQVKKIQWEYLLTKNLKKWTKKKSKKYFQKWDFDKPPWKYAY